MMLLCPNCHGMATKGILKESKQRQFKEQPFNKKRGHSKGRLWVDEPSGTVLLSNTSLTGQGCFVSVGPACLVRIGVGDEGTLELSLTLYDKANTLLLRVDRNECCTGDPSIWDLESDYQFLRLRSKPYNVLLEIDARKVPLTLRAQLWYQGTRIDCKPSRIVMDTPSTKNMLIQGGSLKGFRVAVSADGLSSGIIPMRMHPDDPLFGAKSHEQRLRDSLPTKSKEPMTEKKIPNPLEVTCGNPSAMATVFPGVKENGKPTVGLVIRRDALKEATLNGHPAWVIGLDDDGGPNAAVALSEGLLRNWTKAVELAASGQSTQSS